MSRTCTVFVAASYDTKGLALVVSAWDGHGGTSTALNCGCAERHTRGTATALTSSSAKGRRHSKRRRRMAGLGCKPCAIERGCGRAQGVQRRRCSAPPLFSAGAVGALLSLPRPRFDDPRVDRTGELLEVRAEHPGQLARLRIVGVSVR